MGKNIGPRKGSGFGEKYWVSVREFRIFVWVELPHLGSFAAILTKLTYLCSFWDTFPTGFTKTHRTTDLGSCMDTFLLSVNISMCGA